MTEGNKQTKRDTNQVTWATVPLQQDVASTIPTVYLIICKRDKGKSTEWLGDEDICDLPVLHKELPKVISGHVLCATAYKHFPAPQRLIWTLL